MPTFSSCGGFVSIRAILKFSFVVLCRKCTRWGEECGSVVSLCTAILWLYDVGVVVVNNVFSHASLHCLHLCHDISMRMKGRGTILPRHPVSLDQTRSDRNMLTLLHSHVDPYYLLCTFACSLDGNVACTIGKRQIYIHSHVHAQQTDRAHTH